MESIELMGKDVLPEFIERDEKAVAEKAKRLEPIIEKVEARRPASKAPAFDESYAFGGLPTGRENYTANEVSVAMEEMNAGIEQAAQKLKSGKGWASRNPAADQWETHEHGTDRRPLALRRSARGGHRVRVGHR